MHRKVSFNQSIINSEDASVRAVSNAGLYGKGVFTTIAIIDGEPLFPEAHFSRLTGNAEFFGIVPPDLDGLLASIRELLEVNRVRDGRCRVGIYDESSPNIWSDSLEEKVTILIQTGPFLAKPAVLKLGVSDERIYSKDAMNGIKSVNYVGRLMAFEKVRSRGFSEGIRINENSDLVSGCMANLFWINDGSIFTPKISCGCLAGVTRGFILERCDVSEVEAPGEDIIDAESVFLASSGIGIRFAESVEDREGNLHRLRVMDEDFFCEFGLEDLKVLSNRSSAG